MERTNVSLKLYEGKFETLHNTPDPRMKRIDTSPIVVSSALFPKKKPKQ